MAQRTRICKKNSSKICLRTMFIGVADYSTPSENQIVVLKTIAPKRPVPCPCPYPAVKGLFVGFDFSCKEIKWKFVKLRSMNLSLVNACSVSRFRSQLVCALYNNAL